MEIATSALDSLNQKDVAEIRVYLVPPTQVVKVMNAVQILLGIAKPDWPTAKLMLGDAQFFHQLIHIDKENIPEKVCVPNLRVLYYIRTVITLHSCHSGFQ